MEFFGIDDSSDDPELINDKEKFRNVLKKNVLNKWIKLQKIDEPKMEKNFLKKPILFDHFEALNRITATIKPGSIITNRYPLRTLAERASCSLQMFTCYKIVNGENRKFYVLQASPSRKSWDSVQTYQLGIGLEATVSEDPFCQVTYCYNKFCIKKTADSFIDIHYTAQIDLFNEERNPIEIKSFNIKNYDKNMATTSLPEQFASKTVIQCKIGKTDTLLLGINSYPQSDDIMVKELKVDDIYVGKVKTAVDEGLKRMKENLIKIINEYSAKFEGKYVRIERVILRENRDLFTFVVIDDH